MLFQIEIKDWIGETNKVGVEWSAEFAAPAVILDRNQHSDFTLRTSTASTLSRLLPLPDIPSVAMSLASIEAFISQPQFHDYLAILKGSRNGLVYGVKVRFPHALIMSILFGKGE
jgi:hypothetical protein